MWRTIELTTKICLKRLRGSWLMFLKVCWHWIVAVWPRNTSTLGLKVSSTLAHAEKHTNTRHSQWHRTECDLSLVFQHLIPVLPLNLNMIKPWIVFGRRASLVFPRANNPSASQCKKSLLSCSHGITFYLLLAKSTDWPQKPPAWPRQTQFPWQRQGMQGLGRAAASVTLVWQLTQSQKILEKDPPVETGVALTETKTGQNGTKSLFSAFGLLWGCCDRHTPPLLTLWGVTERLHWPQHPSYSFAYCFSIRGLLMFTCLLVLFWMNWVAMRIGINLVTSCPACVWQSK